MSRIFSRSPFIVSIDETEQVSTKVELYLWNSGVEPSSPQYTLEKKIPASNISLTTYNISPYIREYFKFGSFTGNAGAYDTPTPTDFYANVRVIRLTTDADGERSLDSTLYKAFDGYGTYSEGSNPDLGNVMLAPRVYTYHKSDSFITQSGLSGSITMEVSSGDVIRYTKIGSTDTFNVNITTDGVAQFDRLYTLYRGFGNKVEYLSGGSSVTWTATFKPITECKYTPVYIDFINKFGAWSRLFMYKTSKNKFSTSSSEYNLLQSNVVNYDILEGQIKQLNFEGKESITVNSGWVNESFSEDLKELMTSERVLVNNRPAKCTTNSLDIQTNLNDKTIAYSLNFDFASNYINSVV